MREQTGTTTSGHPGLRLIDEPTPPMSPLKTKSVSIEFPYSWGQRYLLSTKRNKTNPIQGTSKGLGEQTVELCTDGSSDSSENGNSSREDSLGEDELADKTTQKSRACSVSQEVPALISEDQTVKIRWDKLKRYFDSLTVKIVTEQIIIDCLNIERNPVYNASLGVENIAKDIF